jgi:predicted TIM-barrel fold metal-dependent hydrolase
MAHSEFRPYIHDRVVHDADAHIMETPQMLADHVERRWHDKVAALDPFRAVPGYAGRMAEVERKHADPAWRQEEAAQILLRKNWEATGSYLAADRPRALDYLGVASQLVFNTMLSGFLSDAEHGDDLEFAYALARGHNRAMAEFCAVDRRLLSTLYVPLADLDRTKNFAAEAIGMGAKALLIPSRCPKGHSPSHIALDMLWAQAEEAQIPIVFHVGGGGRLIDPNFFKNGLPMVTDFHGGAENFRSVDYMAIPYPRCRPWPP